MALIGTIKDNDNVYVINETAPLCGLESKLSVNNMQSFIPKGCSNTIIAADCDLSKLQIVRNMPNLISPRESKHGITKEYLLKNIVTKIIQEFYRLGVLTVKPFDELKASFVIANKDKAFYLGNKGTIREVKDTEFYCYGNPFLISAMDELETLPLFERIKIAVYRYDELSYSVRFPIVITDTKELKTQFFTRDDCYQAYKNYLEKETI